MGARFSNTAYGPMQLRPLLRARAQHPGERLIGFAVGHLNPTSPNLLMHVGLALIPGIGHIAAMAHQGMLQQGRRRLVVLTSRRILLLKTDRAGPDPTGRGVAADLPLSLLAVRCAPAAIPASPPPARGRLRRARGRSLRRAQFAAQVGVFSLLDLNSGGQIDLTLPRATSGATARLREALVLIAESSDAPAPANEITPGRAGAPAPRGRPARPNPPRAVS